jgi:peroxiredoxin
MEPMPAWVLHSRDPSDHNGCMDTITAPVVPADWDALYDGFVGRLRRSGAGADAPGLYDRFEPFALPDSRGRYVSLKDRLADGPVVLSFMRGGFCPYCRAELQAWHDAIPRLEAVGGHFIAISAEVGGRAEETRCGLAPNAEMLCDVDHGLALSLGLAHPVGPDLHEGYRAHGLYLDEIYGDSGMLLPTPATFVIDSGGVVRYAFVEPDFRVRPDPTVVIAVVEACGPKSASL